MSDDDYTDYPSVATQAVEVANSLHDELHITIDEIRMDLGAKVAVKVYVELINQAKRMLCNLRGELREL